MPSKKRVTKHTRAPRGGRLIRCPRCRFSTVVFHFSWSALGCSACNAMIEKTKHEDIGIARDYPLGFHPTWKVWTLDPDAIAR